MWENRHRKAWLSAKGAMIRKAWFAKKRKALSLYMAAGQFMQISDVTKGKWRRRREQENTTGKHRASEGSPKEKGFSKGGSSAKHRAICAGEKRRRERCGCEDSRRQRSVLQKASEAKLYRGETRKQMACCGAVCYNKRHGKNAVSAAGGKRPRETALRIAYKRKGHKPMDGGKAGKPTGLKRLYR